MEDRFRKIRSTTEYNEGIINISGLSEGRTAPLLSVISKVVTSVSVTSSSVSVVVVLVVSVLEVISFTSSIG